MPAVLYLDRYHLGDPLFLTGFARDVLASPEPLVIVHGSGEAAERALEAQGRIVEWNDGVLAVESDADRALVERAARDLNRQIAHTLNDAGVASVRLDAGSRGLLKAENGHLAVKNIDWLQTLVRQGAVPIVASLLPDGAGAAHELNSGAVAGVLASALSSHFGAVPVLLVAKNSLSGLESAVLGDGEVALEDLPRAVWGEPEVVQAATEAGAEVRLVARADLRGGGQNGVRIGGGVDNKSA